MERRRLWVAFYTMVTREFLRFIRIWIQTVVPPAVTTALYFVIFGKLIGARIGDMDGVAYIDYIVPGLVLMAVITNSYANVVSSFFSAKFHRHIDELLVAPVPEWVILAGYVSGGMARGLIVGSVVTLVAMLFTEVHVHNLPVALAVLVLTAALFATAGFINAVFARSFDDISIVPTFVLTPLTYLGGVFYSVHLLPDVWQKISLANPLLYMINAFRYGMLGVSDISIGGAFAIIIAFVVGLAMLALVLLRLGVGVKT